MAAGLPFLATDVDRWIYGVLSADPLMQQYAPGGFWSRDPEQISNESWNSSGSYRIGDIVTGSDGQPYRSVVDGNAAHDPVSSSGFWAWCFPCVRWWRVSPGRDLCRQDGVSGRVESSPTVFICMLDRQYAGSIDLIGGSNGHLEDGALRICSLLHARRETVVLPGARSFEFTAYASFADTRTEPVDGDFSVMTGHQYQIRVQ